MGLFAKHGMEKLVYAQLLDGEDSDRKLVYLLGHKSQEAVEERFAIFRDLGHSGTHRRQFLVHGPGEGRLDVGEMAGDRALGGARLAEHGREVGKPRLSDVA